MMSFDDDVWNDQWFGLLSPWHHEPIASLDPSWPLTSLPKSVRRLVAGALQRGVAASNAPKTAAPAAAFHTKDADNQVWVDFYLW